MDFDSIKEEAKKRGCRVTDLIVLASQNDPFYIGTKSQVELADWFTDLWQRFGYNTDIHLRRIHYRIISQETPINLPNGKTLATIWKRQWKICILIQCQWQRKQKNQWAVCTIPTGATLSSSKFISTFKRLEKQMFILTDEDILKDIRGFERRIQFAREKLSELPQKIVSWKEQKRLDEKKRILNDEIRHVRKLIDIAKEALEGDAQ